MRLTLNTASGTRGILQRVLQTEKEVPEFRQFKRISFLAVMFMFVVTGVLCNCVKKMGMLNFCFHEVFCFAPSQMTWGQL